MEFYRNRKKSINLILIYAGILILMIAILIYSIGIFTDRVVPKGIAFSSLFGLVMLFVIIKSLLSLKDTSPLLVLNEQGIISKVTAMSKAAGLIFWEDIIAVEINKMGGDTLITLVIDKAEKYTPVIRKKLSAIALDGAKDANGNLMVYLTASELDLDAQELFAEITKYRNGLRQVPNLQV